MQYPGQSTDLQDWDPAHVTGQARGEHLYFSPFMLLSTGPVCPQRNSQQVAKMQRAHFYNGHSCVLRAHMYVSFWPTYHLFFFFPPFFLPLSSLPFFEIRPRLAEKLMWCLAQKQPVWRHLCVFWHRERHKCFLPVLKCPQSLIVRWGCGYFFCQLYRMSSYAGIRQGFLGLATKVENKLLLDIFDVLESKGSRKIVK